MKYLYTLLICLLIIPTQIQAQSAEEDAKSRLQELITYLDKASAVSPDRLDSLSRQLIIAEDAKKPRRERAKNWEMIQKYFFNLVADPDTSYRDRWLQFGGYPLFASFFEHRLPSAKKGPKTDISLPGRVQQYGTGDIPMVMIPPAGFDDRVFEPFIDQFGSKYKIYTITLPGYAGVAPYPREERRNLKNMTWFDHIDQALLSLLERERIQKAFFLGNGLGAFVAMRFGLRHPAHVKGIVSINGILKQDMKSLEAAGEGATPEERLERVNTIFPKAEFVPFPVFQPYASFQSPWSVQTKAIRAEVVEKMNEIDLYAHHIYNDQMMAADLEHELRDLQVPLLALTSVHDELSRFVVFSRNSVINWQKLALKHADKPIRLIPMQKTRNLVLYDKPVAAGRLINSFTDDPEGFVTTPAAPEVAAVNKSPRAGISQIFANTEVTVDYSRPAVQGRSLFGGLIPYDRPWRAGANEGTEITFSRDTYVGDNLLGKGTYTLFIIPGKEQWTIVFNHILNQWNVGNYETAFDALRINVEPRTEAHQEWLKYDFENLTDVSADLTLHWGRTKINIPLRESFNPAYCPKKIRQFAWKLLLEDTISDGRSPQSADGKAFYYHHDLQSDSLWFKLETYNAISMINPALSVSLDTDNDQSNGANWYGSNRQFKVDMMLSAGPVRQGDGYAGWNGITNAEGIRTSTWINVIDGNISFYFDPDGHAYYLGVRRQDLGPQTQTINLIGSVGANSLWNDDIGKEGQYATIELKN